MDISNSPARSCRRPGSRITGSLAARLPRSSASTPSRRAEISRPTTSVRLSPIPTKVSEPRRQRASGRSRAWAEMPGHPCCSVFRPAGRYRNILEVANGGWIDGLYVQDQIKATSHLTVNVGFRKDLVWTPIYGTHEGGAGNFYTGNANPITGQYELNALPPDCSATQGAPCIPTGIYTASKHACSGRPSPACLSSTPTPITA